MQCWLRPSAMLMALLLGAGACRADALTEKVLESFRSRAPDLRVTARTDDELEVTSRKGPLAVNLTNLRAACASGKDRCDDEVAAYVRSVASVISADALDSAFVAEKVHAVLRNAGSGRHAGTAKEPGKQVVALPFVQSIEVLFVVDGERAMRYVNRDDMVVAGLTEKTLLELASRNAARLPPLKHEPINGMPGLYFMPASDGLGTSRAFDAALWEKLEAEAGGALAMAVPTRDWVLFTRADQPEAVARLRALAGRIARGEPYPVSDAVMARDGIGWKALPVR